MKTDSIRDQLVYSTIRIVATDGKGVSIGTGFFVTDFPVEDNDAFLVTNKHVVEKFNTAHFMFCGRDKDNNPVDSIHVTITVDNLQNRIIPHPDANVDLCLINLNDVIEQAFREGRTPYYIAIGTDFFVTEDVLKHMTAIENVIMIGYPEGLMDVANNKPVVRKGITATSLNLDYSSKKEFMIDMAVFHGSSGSPVILEHTRLRQGKAEKGFTLGIDADYWLVGVVYGVPKRTVEGELKIVEAPTSKKVVSKMELMTNLGFVIKAERVRELLKLAGKE